MALPSLLGVISDTHGLLRPSAVKALEGSDLIIHAGDVGTPEILDQLGRIAPVVAVRGNVDRDAWAEQLPRRAVVGAASARILIVHNLHDLDLDPAVAGFDVVICGHSHKPAETERAGVLYLNPGSAGPRRFKLPVTVAKLDLAAAPFRVEMIDLFQ